MCETWSKLMSKSSDVDVITAVGVNAVSVAVVPRRQEVDVLRPDPGAERRVPCPERRVPERQRAVRAVPAQRHGVAVHKLDQLGPLHQAGRLAGLR